MAAQAILRLASSSTQPTLLMKPDSVFCIAYSRLQADQMVQRLKGEAFSIHDISVLAATGPVMAALGDVVSGLQSQGVNWAKARLYESRLREGRILVSVQARGAEAIKLAKEILVKAGGNDISTSRDADEPFLQKPKSQTVRANDAQLSFA